MTEERGLNMCEHDVVIVEYRLRDMVRDYWRMLWGRNGLTPGECRGRQICKQCGQVLSR